MRTSQIQLPLPEYDSNELEDKIQFLLKVISDEFCILIEI